MPCSKIAEEARAAAALGHALRQLALGDLLLAEGALLHHALLLVEIAHAVGAGHGAELAADALRLVDLHGAVLELMCEAPVGHTFTHSGFSQCWHCTGRKYISTSWALVAPSGFGFGPMRSTLFQ